MALDFQNILGAVVGAAQQEAGQTWPQIRTLAEQSFRDLTQAIVEAGEGVIRGEATPDEAKVIVEEAIRAATGVLAAAIVGGKAAAQRIVNAALAAVRQTINTAVGFVLV
jgi:hypothetical protein